MNKSLLLLLMPFMSLAGELKIKNSSVFVPSRLGQLSISRTKDGYFANKDGQRYKIKNHDIDSKLLNLSNNKLKKFLKRGGYLSVNQMSNNDYSLKAQVRGNGGGPIAGYAAYLVTKAICYGTAAAAAATAVVSTGGMAGAATGALVAGGTAGVSTGAGIAAGAIAGAGLSTEAGLVTATFVGGAGSISGAVAVVETISASVGTLFGMIPILP